jgi:hypothetical protein
MPGGGQEIRGGWEAFWEMSSPKVKTTKIISTFLKIISPVWPTLNLTVLYNPCQQFPWVSYLG